MNNIYACADGNVCTSIDVICFPSLPLIFILTHQPYAIFAALCGLATNILSKTGV